jgi:osmotically-inducible protein OsmY
MSHKTDEQITQDVLAELAWDPAVRVADLTVSTEQGRVTLKGTCDTYGTKLDAEDAAYRVGGIRFVANEIVVNPPAPDVRTDLDIASDIRSAFALDFQVPDDQISVRVVNGYVTLTGNVDWYYQKNAAEIASAIARAFERNAELYDDHIKVKADGGHVTLSGTVATWSEFALAEEIAWMAPGVISVTSKIGVLLP